MTNIPNVNQIEMKSYPTGTQLILKTNTDTFSFMFSTEQLSVLYTGIAKILNPDQQYVDQIKRLKEFKRQVFTHYKQEQDPEIKQEKLNLYIETKKLVEDLEKRK